jgi:hypothetical protein
MATIDLTPEQQAQLVPWALRRLEVDYDRLIRHLILAGELVEPTPMAVGLNVEVGAVLVRDDRADAVYVLGEPDTLIRQGGGRETFWRDGVEIYNETMPAWPVDDPPAAV